MPFHLFVKEYLPHFRVSARESLQKLGLYFRETDEDLHFARQILQQFVNVEHLDFVSVPWNTNVVHWDLESSKVKLLELQLQTTDLTGVELSQCLRDLSNTLHFPNLKTLRFSFFFGDMEDNLDELSVGGKAQIMEIWPIFLSKFPRLVFVEDNNDSQFGIELMERFRLLDAPKRQAQMTALAQLGNEKLPSDLVRHVSGFV
jgi:hypothetical protein